MVSLGHILRDYRDAGSVNSLLAISGFVDDSTFLTKAGHVGVAYRMRAVDYEGLSHPQRQTLVHRFEAGLRLLDEHCRLYQYLFKRTVQPFVAAACEQPIANEAIQRRAAYLNGRRQELYELSLFLVLLYEATHMVRRSTELKTVLKAPREALSAWLSTDHAVELLGWELDQAIGTLHHKAQGFEVLISDFGPERLCKRDAFRFLRTLVNYAPAVVDGSRLNYDTHVDYFVSDSGIECHRDHLLVGGPHGQGALDERTAEPHVRVSPAGPVRSSRRVRCVPRMATDFERSHASKRAKPAKALLQQASLDRELRRTRDTSGGDARHRRGTITCN